MICSINAQALVSGEVESLSINHRDTDAAGQLEDLRNLIAEGVDAIIVNPADRSALDDALAEATEAGITVVAVDQAVTEESAFVLSNDQEEYAYLGASWLFEKMGGSGDVVYMRGIAGAAADDDRDAGFQRALDENPDINVVFESQTDWDQAKGTQQFTDFLATGDNFDGIWTSGIDNVIVRQCSTPTRSSFRSSVPTTPASWSSCSRSTGSSGPPSRTPPPSAARASLSPSRSSTARSRRSRSRSPSRRSGRMTPRRASPSLEEANDPDIDPTWPLQYTLEGLDRLHEGSRSSPARGQAPNLLTNDTQ